MGRWVARVPVPERFQRFTECACWPALGISYLGTVKSAGTNLHGHSHGAFGPDFRVLGSADVVVDGALLSWGKGVPAFLRFGVLGRGPQ